jgi:hypothetical protein
MSPLPSIITPALLSSIRKHPNLPHHTWYFITATTLSILNRPDELPILYKYVLEHGPGNADSRPTHDEQLRASRRIREAIIKSAAIGGLPKAILPFSSFPLVNSYHPPFCHSKNKMIPS